MKILPDWLTAIGTIGAVLVALFLNHWLILLTVLKSKLIILSNLIVITSHYMKQ